MSQNIFSLEGLISWLEPKPPGDHYKYTNGQRCLIHDYFETRGLSVSALGPRDWTDGEGEGHNLPRLLNKVAVKYPRTYGAALQRAREMLAA